MNAKWIIESNKWFTDMLKDIKNIWINVCNILNHARTLRKTPFIGILKWLETSLNM